MSASDTLDGARPTILTVPGLYGSGPSHWQSVWEATRDDVVRVELGMWDTPHRNVWVTRLDEAIRRARGPVILAAHSLGCLAVAWWAHLSAPSRDGPVAGALLVAPADIDGEDCPETLRGFAPSPRSALPFPSIVVASSDDPWIDVEQARRLAAQWGSQVVEVGAQGHLNADSALGDWQEGQALLDRIARGAFRESGSIGAISDDGPADRSAIRLGTSVRRDLSAGTGLRHD